MNAKTKGFFYTLLIGAVLVPVVYLGGVNASGTCEYPIMGNTSADYYENTGILDFDDAGSNACVDDDGKITGGVYDSNIGMVYFDQNGASVIIDEDGNWSGKVYAPLSADLTSTQGTFFMLDGVATDLETGLVTGHADSVNLGELSFNGAIQKLSSLQVGLDFYVETFGDTVVTSSGETIPVADGGDSGYKLVAEIDFSATPYGVTEAFLAGDFLFDGFVTADEVNSDLRLDQVNGTGSQNDAVERAYNFELKKIDGSKAYYYIGDVSSYAPTSDTRCSYSDGLEACGVSESDFMYFLDKMSVEGRLPRSFEWISSGDYSVSETTVTYDGDFQGAAKMDVSSEDLSFAPMYEVDGFGVLTSDGSVADSMDEIPTLAEGVLYDFGGTFVQNGEDALTQADLTIDYSIDDADYTFAGSDCSQDSFFISKLLAGGLNDPGDEIPFSDIQLCPADDGANLDSDVQASADTLIGLRFIDGTDVYYPSEGFSFADTRAEISENPRVYVIGTVSGLAESDDVTVVGNMGKLELRDALFEQIAKATKNVSADYIFGGGMVNSAWERSGGGVDLSGGDVLYFIGDGSGAPVSIDGGLITSGMHKTIVVVGTNVFIDGNIYREDGVDGELGIVVLADENGDGGDLYVDNDVTDLHANIFLDGSLTRANSDGVVYDAVDSTSQLYILGSIVSDNTIEGYEEGVSCVCGDGTQCDADPYDACTEEEAMVEDLQYTSYFRVCCTDEGCEYDSGGNVELPYEECSGFERSTYDGEDWSFPVVIEYSPPSSSMPIFSGGGSSVE